MFLFILSGNTSALATEMDPRVYYCQGKLPGYGYQLRVVDNTTIDILSVTSTGRFSVDPILPVLENMLPLRGTLIGIQHRWTEERMILVSENIFSPGESTAERILEISGIPFFCTNQMPPNFQ